MKSRVIMFLPAGVGGAERMSMSIAGYLASADFDVCVCIIGRKRGNIEDFIPVGVRVIHIFARNQWDFLTVRILSLLKTERYDILFTSHFYLAPKVILAAKVLGNAKTVIRIPDYMSAINGVIRFFCKLTFNYADIIIAQQDEMRNQIRDAFHINEKKIRVLLNPVNTELIDSKVKDCQNPFPNDTVNYLLVARMNFIKGHDRILSAFKLVHDKNPKANLYFIGNPGVGTDFNTKVKKMIVELGLSDSVHILGHDNNPYRWMKYCDCFVLGSRREGLPNVLIEAQYLGTPCAVIQCIPVIGRIVSNGINGFVIDSYSPEAFAEAMEKATSLGRVSMTYKSADKSDFISVFESFV